MYRLLLISLFLAVSAANGQGLAVHVIFGPNLPAFCSPNTGDIYFKTTGAVGVKGLYSCDSPNTWVFHGNGGGNVTSFNGRAGAVTLLSSDVLGVLNYLNLQSLDFFSLTPYVSAGNTTNSIASYYAGLNTALGITQSHIGPNLPALALYAQHIPANSQFLDGNGGGCNILQTQQGTGTPCKRNNLATLNSYTDAMFAAGAVGLNIQMDLTTLAADSQYPTIVTAQTGTLLTSDCAERVLRLLYLLPKL